MQRMFNIQKKQNQKKTKQQMNRFCSTAMTENEKKHKVLHVDAQYDGRFALTMLTCNDRQTIFVVIRSIFMHCALPSDTNWYILLQGCTPQHDVPVRVTG